MRARLVVATPIPGPLSDQQLDTILNNFKDIHQFRRVDSFTVVFTSAPATYQLDHAGLSTVVDYFRRQHNPACQVLRYLTMLLASVAVRPKPEPEVLRSRKPDPKPIPEPVELPAWLAKVRFKTHGGTYNEVHEINSMADLDDIINRGPPASMLKNVKIKLEYQR